MNKTRAIEEAIADLKTLAKSSPRISFVFTETCPDEAGIFETIVDMNGQVRATLYEEDGREPHVIESVELEIDGVTVHCQRGRPATASDRKRGQSHTHRSEYVATSVAG